MHIMTIDVEDWFHILGLDQAPDQQAWQQLDTIIPQGMTTILELFEKYQVKSTFFWLGWAAERYPDLVKRCQEQGHEIAIHGYGHQLVHSMTPEQFREDIQKAMQTVYNASGVRATAYRAPGFSITETEMWAYDILLQEGIEVDASVFPAKHGHGGQSSASLKPHLIERPGESLKEIPISLNTVFNKRLCLCGGGYFRLFPYEIIRYGLQQCDKQQRPGVIYLHPREFVANHPRMAMPFVRKFKCYVNLHSVQQKLKKLFSEFSFTTVANYLQHHPL